MEENTILVNTHKDLTIECTTDGQLDIGVGEKSTKCVTLHHVSVFIAPPMNRLVGVHNLENGGSEIEIFKLNNGAVTDTYDLVHIPGSSIDDDLSKSAHDYDIGNMSLLMSDRECIGRMERALRIVYPYAICVALENFDRLYLTHSFFKKGKRYTIHIIGYNILLPNSRQNSNEIDGVLRY